MSETYPFDLGAYSRPVSENSDAQIWFDRGLTWLFGFNHDEAIVCFRKALEHDAELALAHWGVASAIGPNYNKPWAAFPWPEKMSALETAATHIAAGLEIATPNSLEASLLQALQTRYPDDPKVKDFDPFSAAYAAAMVPISAAAPEDLDLAFFTLEAQMNRTPWQLWDLETGDANPDGAALEVKRKLDDLFATRADAWAHPGLLHLYIHLMEMSQTPESALRHGDVLTGLCPDAGHLVHMATHIDVLVGDYQNVVARNLAAAAVDDRFKDYAGGANFYALYRIHNLHFAIYGAMFLAQQKVALRTADRLQAEVPEDVVRVYPDLFEAFVATRPHVLIRFGRWAEILEEPIPQDAELYTCTRGILFYARAVALANLGRHAEAQAERTAFLDALAAVPEKRKLFQNNARDILEIARNMMEGELAFKAGDHAAGLEHLRAAVRADDGLMYEEPWSWPQPSRHALGALLIEAGEWGEAEAVYRADLGLDTALPRALQNPRNVWALHGLHECLLQRGETVERPHIKAQLDLSRARADVPIRASCLCRSSATPA